MNKREISCPSCNGGGSGRNSFDGSDGHETINVDNANEARMMR